MLDFCRNSSLFRVSVITPVYSYFFILLALAYYAYWQITRNYALESFKMLLIYRVITSN